MIILVLDTPNLGLIRQRFIAFSAGEFKQRLRGIEFGSKMIYNESNKAVDSTALFVRDLNLPFPMIFQAK
jgi:hypothetical protein